MTTRFLRRDFPNANSILLTGPAPVLVDAGAPGGEPGLLAWLGPVRPSLLVNTHWHSDHAGGNHALAALGVPIAAAAPEAARVNAGDPDACRSTWLRQTVPPFRVTRPLAPDDAVETGTARWRVVALPGHTATQIGLFEPRTATLIAGDALHDTDIGWLDIDADPSALHQAEVTIDTVAHLAPSLVLSGHGPAITNVPAAIERARRRLASWHTDPGRIAWHACKRIFGHLLYTTGGLDPDQIEATLLDAPWFVSHATRAFQVSPAAFVPMLLDQMLASGAATWSDGRLSPPHPADTG